MRILALIERFFVIDLGINCLLGGVLIAFPETIDGLLVEAEGFSAAIYRLIGAGLLAFALWQIQAIARGSITAPATLRFGGIMALLPAAALGGLLAFGDLRLTPIGSVAVWAAIVYMVLLGAWYLLAFRESSRRLADAS
ncbi:MAG: hypothetical protein ACC647_07730 [Anaerolineales bacterium]